MTHEAPKSINKVLLRDLIIKVFNSDEVDQLCFELGVERTDIDRSGDNSLANFVQELINHLERRKRLSDLVRACQAKRPSKDWEDVYREKLSPLEESSMKQLNSDLKREDVLPYVVEFRERLQNFRESLLRCKDYKVLHDHLHKLQFVYLDKIERTISDARQSHTGDSLHDLERDMQYALVDLKSITQRSTDVQKAMLPFLDRLQQAQSALAQAIESNGSGAAHLKPVFDLLAVHLDRQLAQVNHALKGEAQRLGDQVSLWKTIEEVRDLVVDNSNNGALIARLDHGVSVLEDMRAKRESKVIEHDLWQRLHDELIPIRTKPAEYLKPKSYTWLLVQELNEQVLRTRSDSEMRRFRVCWENLVATVNSDQGLGIAPAFKAYSDAMEWCFYIVDSDLARTFEDQSRLLPLLEDLLRAIDDRAI